MSSLTTQPLSKSLQIDPDGQVLCNHYAQCGGRATFVMGSNLTSQQYAFCKPGCMARNAAGLATSSAPTFVKQGGVPRIGLLWDSNSAWQVIHLIDTTMSMGLRPSIEQVIRVRRDNVV